MPDELWQDISLWVFFKCSPCTVSVVAFIGHKFSMYQLEQSFATQLLWPIDFSKLGCASTEMHGILLYKHQHIYTLFSFKSAIASSKKQTSYIITMTTAMYNTHPKPMQCQRGIDLCGDPWNMQLVMTINTGMYREKAWSRGLTMTSYVVSDILSTDSPATCIFAWVVRCFLCFALTSGTV